MKKASLWFIVALIGGMFGVVVSLHGANISLGAQAIQIAALQKEVKILRTSDSSQTAAIGAIRDFKIPGTALEQQVFDGQTSLSYLAEAVDPSYARREFSSWTTRGKLNDDESVEPIILADFLAKRNLLTKQDVASLRRVTVPRWGSWIDTLYVR